MSTAPIRAAEAAVAARPDDHGLRVHLGRLRLDAGFADAAVVCAAAVLRVRPDHPGARALMAAVLRGATSPTTNPGPPAQPGPGIPTAAGLSAHPGTGPRDHRFDWDTAEADLGDHTGPHPARSDSTDPGPAEPGPGPFNRGGR